MSTPFEKMYRTEAPLPSPASPASEFCTMLGRHLVMHEKALKEPSAQGKDVRMIYCGALGEVVIRNIWPENTNTVGILFANEHNLVSRIFTPVSQCTIKFEIYPALDTVEKRPEIGFGAEMQKETNP